jgi:hypothetical protein
MCYLLMHKLVYSKHIIGENKFPGWNIAAQAAYEYELRIWHYSENRYSSDYWNEQRASLSHYGDI